ncbi:MAG TPA: right-handed parallel beta-helix repeat-containing protein [Solirubrobacteraceae bacterium]|nr:right-handed parallel beta-helix repeat-containing protein [Solirubrobacteraceae bacterium]
MAPTPLAEPAPLSAPAPGTSTMASTLAGEGESAAGAAVTVVKPAVSNLSAIPGPESLTARWSVTTTENLAGFRVRYRPSAAPLAPWSAPVDLKPGVRRYPISGLTVQPYQVLVRALTVDGTLGGAQIVTGVPLPPENEVPLPPENEVPPPPEKPVEEEKPRAPSCSRYAANGGSDINSGTASAPFRTVKRLIVSLAAGQTGCLQSGQAFDTEPDSTGQGSITIRGGESHGEAGAPVTITSTDPANPAVISHSLSLTGGADWLTFTHLKFEWALPGQCTWSALAVASSCPAESHVQIAVSSRHASFTWDEITSKDTNICMNLVKYNGYTATSTLIEHDVIHDCGTPVRAPGEPGYHVNVNEEPGWHEHGIYDYANHTTIRNNYFYNVSRAALLFYPEGNGAVVEHNVIDHNGVGVWLAGTANVLVRNNIITNATSPRRYEDYGVGSNGPGQGNVIEHNCMYGNVSGNFGVESLVELLENLLDTNPLYVNSTVHDYELLAGSPCTDEAPK